MVRLYSFLIGYVFGLFQSAYIVGKAHGIDIREHGSGNAGTTNALRVLGRKVGLLVFLGDVLKAMFAVILVKLLFGNTYPDMKYLLCIYAGVGCVLSHDFPFYMNFKGGKGIAVTGGMILGFHPLFILFGLCQFFIPFFVTHYVSLGSLILYGGFLIEFIVCGQLGLFGGMSQGMLFEMYGLILFLTVLAYWQHRANIGRLLRHEESKTYLGKKKEAQK